MTDKITGGNNSYYVVDIVKPIRPEHKPYTAECGDIIEALGMTFNEGCIFKALWRSCAERTLGLKKPGSTDGQALYDAEKSVYYANRIVAECQKRKSQLDIQNENILEDKEYKGFNIVNYKDGSGFAIKNKFGNAWIDTTKKWGLIRYSTRFSSIQAAEACIDLIISGANT